MIPPGRINVLFICLFAAVALLEMLGDTLAIRWLHYGSKPLIMALLILYVRKSFPSVRFSAYIRWLLFGMAFALIGDSFLMIREVDLFAPGLGAFLAMQLCYCTAFRQSVRASGQPVAGRSVWLKALPFVVYSGVFLAVLKPAFNQNPALTNLWWPVVAYSLCLSTMGLAATLRQGLPGYGRVIVGALLFILSDSLIAIDKFLYPLTGAPWLIMSTYAAAQYLIVVGMLQPLSTPLEKKE